MLPLVLATGVAIAIQAILVRTSMIREIIAGVGIAVIIVLIWRALMGLAPVECVRFRSKQGAVLFDIVRETKQAEDFERFVSALLSRLSD